MLFYVAYKVNIRALEPFSDDDVYVDAKTGKILYTVSQIREVTGTAATRYSGSKTISTQQNGAVYRLRGYDNGRSIETYNMLKGTNPSNAIDFTDNDNNWTSGEFHNANKDDAALEAHWSAMMTWDYFKMYMDGTVLTVMALHSSFMYIMMLIIQVHFGIQEVMHLLDMEMAIRLIPLLHWILR